MTTIYELDDHEYPIEVVRSVVEALRRNQPVAHDTDHIHQQNWPWYVKMRDQVDRWMWECTNMMWLLEDHRPGDNAPRVDKRRHARVMRTTAANERRWRRLLLNSLRNIRLMGMDDTAVLSMLITEWDRDPREYLATTRRMVAERIDRRRHQ